MAYCIDTATGKIEKFKIQYVTDTDNQTYFLIFKIPKQTFDQFHYHQKKIFVWVLVAC